MDKKKKIYIFDMLNLGYFKVFITFSVTNFTDTTSCCNIVQKSRLNIFGQNPML